jgi:carbon storage regulator
MLILTRKVGETIRIGDNVTVRVLALRGGQVSLGFTAPNEVRIFREEVLRGEAPAPATSAPPTDRAAADAPFEVAARPPAKARPGNLTARNVATRHG